MKFCLIDEWRESWKFISVQLGWAAAAIAASISTAFPSLVISMLSMDLRGRIVVGIMLLMGVGGLPWLARILKQPTKECSDGE